MKNLILLITLIVFALNSQAQTTIDSTSNKVVEIQKNLNSYYNQTRTGTGIFAFGTILGTTSFLCISDRPEDKRMKNAFIGISATSMVLGLLINMEAVKFIGRASQVSISPGAVTVTF